MISQEEAQLIREEREKLNEALELYKQASKLFSSVNLKVLGKTEIMIAKIDKMQIASDAINSIDSIDKIKLYTVVNHYGQMHSPKLSDLISEIDENSVIVFVQNTSQYMLFKNFEEYAQFTDYLHLNSPIEQQEMQLYQIILGDQKQKLSIRYLHDMKEENFIELAKTFFKTDDIKVCKNELENCNQMLVNLEFENRFKSAEKMEAFSFYLEKNKHSNISLQTLPIHAVGPTDRAYAMLKIDQGKYKIGDLADILSQIGTIHNLQIIVDNSIKVNGNNINAIQGNGNNIQMLNNSNIKEFTDANAPDGKFKTEFYETYKNFCTARGVPPKSKREFAKDILNMGYKDGRYGTKRIWKK